MEEKFYTFNQLIFQRAKDENQTPLFAFPKSRFAVADYELFTGAKLNQLIDGAAKAFIQSGITSVVGTSTIQHPH